MLRYLLGLAILVYSASLTLSCSSKNIEEDFPSPAVCDTANVTYSGSIKPIFDEICLDCHYEGNDNNAPEFHLYDNIKLYADFGILYGVITHTQMPFMPKDRPKLSDCDIAKFRIWIENGAPND